MSLSKSYEEFVQFEISDIVWDDGFSGIAGGDSPGESERDAASGTFVGEEAESLPYSDIPNDELTDRQDRILQDAIDSRIEDANESIAQFNENNLSISFEYSNPAVGIDTGGNFVKHDIIGGPTVRQKIGSKPMEISIKGVAKEKTTHSLEALRNARRAKLISNRFPEDSVPVHIISVTTDPLEDGGAASFNNGEFLYAYSIECVEINNIQEEDSDE